MADEQKPGGSEAPPPQGDGAPKPPAKPAAAAPKAPPKPAAPAAPKAPAVMAAVPWESDLAKEIKERFGDRIVETSSYLGQNFIVTRPEAAVPVLEYLKLEADFDYLVDVTAADWPKRPERFDLVYIAYSFPRNERVRIKTYIAEGYKPETAVGVHLTANWLEREVFDMFGIEFAGHPDPRRILMPDEWQGHPLRKDYSILQQDQRWVQENLNIESGQ
jgi:NADH-quinone oxidoreductase subunit C